MTREDMQALQKLSRRGSSVEGIMRFDGFDVHKVFNEFTEYLEGYQQFITEETDTDVTRERILESLDRFIEKTLSPTERIKYSDMADFYYGYEHESENLRAKVLEIKSDMLLESVQPESVGDVGDFAEKFIESVGKKHVEVIEKVLCENGYRNMAIPKKSKEEKAVEVEEEVTFI
ncbi:MAG: hypothetical protein HDQ88_00760 [Clostridia bacterium]|nr:hypothetical protein [Clostridia bacterium]